MTSLDVAIGLAVLAWVAVLIVSFTVPFLRVDPTANLVLMGVIGALVTYRNPSNRGRST